MPSIRGNAFYYLIGTLVGRASGLVLIPLYILLLTPQEAGAWAVLAVLRTLVSAGATCGLDGYLTQEYWRREEIVRPGLIGACRSVVLKSNLVIAALALPCVWWEPARLWVLTLVGGQAMAFVTVVLAQYRIEERARAHCLTICLTGGGGAVLAAILVCAGLGVAGLAIGFAVPPVLAAAWLAVRQRPSPIRDPSMPAYVRRLLPARLMAEVAGQADRLVLAGVVDAAQLGLYDLAARCAGVIGTVLSSAKNAVLPAILKALAGGGDDPAAWAAWSRTRWLALAGSGLLLGCAVLLAWLFPEHAWSPAVIFLPGALMVPLWTHASLGNAAAIYHHRAVAIQAWQPLIALVLVTGGAVAGGVIRPAFVPWGAVLGLAAVLIGVRWRLRSTRRSVDGDGGEIMQLAIASCLFLVITIVQARF